MKDRQTDSAEQALGPARPLDSGPVTIIANEKSGTNARDSEAIDRAREGMGRESRLTYWEPGSDLGDLIDKEVRAGASAIIAAGGDGTAMAVAGEMLGLGVPMGVLPLGTFNFYARGLGLSEDPAEAGRQITASQVHDIHVGTVGGRVFLNNASLGIYPSILKERETVYARWGRRRIMAHWSVAKTFLRFQRPMHLTLDADGETMRVRTPLVFVARSAYQLERFGLTGTDAIHEDRFAVLLGLGDTRMDLFRLAARLATRSMQEGQDYRLITPRSLTVETARDSSLVAFDGEKTRERSPFEFRMSQQPLTILKPQKDPET